MNKYRDLFEKYVVDVGRAPHALTRVWVLGFCDWLARNDSGLTKRAADKCPDGGIHGWVPTVKVGYSETCTKCGTCR